MADDESQAIMHRSAWTYLNLTDSPVFCTAVIHQSLLRRSLLFEVRRRRGIPTDILSGRTAAAKTNVAAKKLDLDLDRRCEVGSIY